MAEIRLYWRLGLGLAIGGAVGLILSILSIFNNDFALAFSVACIYSATMLAIGAALLKEGSNVVKIKRR